MRELYLRFMINVLLFVLCQKTGHFLSIFETQFSRIDKIKTHLPPKWSSSTCSEIFEHIDRIIKEISLFKKYMKNYQYQTCCIPIWSHYV